MSIIKKVLKNPCYKCNGQGKIKGKKCSACEGTGYFYDNIYYYIDDKKKIAIDGDSFK